MSRISRAINHIYIGVDPGKKGGIAFIYPEGCYGAYPMPETRNQVYKLLQELKTKYGATLIAAVELVHSMPKQGVASTFTFGKGCGEVLGILTALDAVIYEPTPQAWKKVMMAGTDKSKDAAIQVAENLFPDIQLVPKGCRVPNDGMAEALLLAEWCHRQFNKGG